MPATVTRDHEPLRVRLFLLLDRVLRRIGLL
jgi:hypothetical protein